MTPTQRLQHHVTGAIERCEGVAIQAITADYDYRNIPQQESPSVIEGARFYKTAVIAQDVLPFEKGQYVSVRFTRTVFNHFTQKNEDLFFVWANSGDKYPSELFARALTDFCI